MSVVRNSYTWRAGIINSNLPSTTRHVLLTLSCHFNDAGEACYPSQRLLAEETGLSERAVVAHLGSARELGWLQVSKHGFAGQKWANNQYMPSFPEGTEPHSAPCEKGTEPHSAPCGKGTEPNDKKVLNDVHTNYSVELLSLNTTTTAPEAHGGGVYDDLAIEPVIAPFLPQLLDIMRQAGIADPAHAQNLLDELAGTIAAGNCGERAKVGNPISWLKAVVARKFQPARCVGVQARRQSTKASGQLTTRKPTQIIDPVAAAKGAEIVAQVFARKRKQQSQPQHP